MANILPKETLQAEWGRFKSRLFLVGALVLLCAAAISGLALLPAHVALQVEKNAAARPDAETTALPQADRQMRRERDEVMRAQALLDSVSPIISATSSPTESINAALSLRPSGVRVDRIAFAAGPNGEITISGISPRRDSINQYKEALAKSERFKNVSVPVGALVGTEDGKFTITLSGTF